jgi:hypothetical protein
METCNNDHDSIAYAADECPLCAALERLSEFEEACGDNDPPDIEQIIDAMDTVTSALDCQVYNVADRAQSLCDFHGEVTDLLEGYSDSHAIARIRELIAHEQAPAELDAEDSPVIVDLQQLAHPEE